ncbi:hypothetical protein GCM10023149_51680 [Mucilaginibacter gynuensis]|uniref:DUF2281 domain-containing protein n=1 Tax=Mucilaginibacter gynuensis TaxID=1302236 RepID=A0ABP8HJU5_9SPHI
MTSVEIKTEIQKLIDEVPETLLPDILNYLHQVKDQHPILTDDIVTKIISEDRELLKKLAQ